MARVRVRGQLFMEATGKPLKARLGYLDVKFAAWSGMCSGSRDIALQRARWGRGLVKFVRSMF